jgi:hypothetical protein
MTRPHIPDVDSTLELLETSTENALGERTLKDMVLAGSHDI